MVHSIEMRKECTRLRGEERLSINEISRRTGVAGDK